MRKTRTYKISNLELFKKQILSWSQQYRETVWMDSNQYEQKYSNYDAVLAVDAFTSIQTDYVDAFEKLKEYQSNTADWIFGYLTYDLKNTVERLKSDNFDGLQFPDLYFFQPQKLFLLKAVLRTKHCQLSGKSAKIKRLIFISLKTSKIKRLIYISLKISKIIRLTFISLKTSKIIRLTSISLKNNKIIRLTFISLKTSKIIRIIFISLKNNKIMRLTFISLKNNKIIRLTFISLKITK